MTGGVPHGHTHTHTLLVQPSIRAIPSFGRPAYAIKNFPITDCYSSLVQNQVKTVYVNWRPVIHAIEFDPVTYTVPEDRCDVRSGTLEDFCSVERRSKTLSSIHIARLVHSCGELRTRVGMCVHRKPPRGKQKPKPPSIEIQAKQSKIVSIPNDGRSRPCWCLVVPSRWILSIPVVFYASRLFLRTIFSR